MAMIKTEHLHGEIWAEIYYEKELRQYDKVARCSIKEKPFWAPTRARMTPPEHY
jgi:aminomethyltransferase